MTTTATVLIPAKNAEAAQTTQYISANVRTIIDKMTATNYSVSAATLSVNLVTFADTAGNQNLIVKVKTLQPGETYTWPEVTGHVLGVGDFISTIASAGSAINIRASGRVIS